VLEQGYRHIEASRSVGVAELALGRWVRRPDQQRIQELAARIERIERIEREQAILKKLPRS